MSDGMWAWMVMIDCIAVLGFVGYYFFGDENGQTVFEVKIPDWISKRFSPK